MTAVLLDARPAAAQVDSARAAGYFREAAALCERDGGKLWGISLCGPMVIADAATKTIATNQPAPTAKQPAVLGYANSALDWGGTRWTTLVWSMIPADERARGGLMLHELFHRIQPQLGLLVNDGRNDHLDSLEGRYWLQLEWRALALALGQPGAERAAAVRDALGFRAKRRGLFAGAADNERRMEINEGLAQYTGVAASTGSAAAAATVAIAQLGEYERQTTFVRTFPYPLGAAYGLLLDEWLPRWTRGIRAGDDLGEMLRAASRLTPNEEVDAAALRYGGPELRVAEQRRDSAQRIRLAELRRRFVEGPVLVLPNGRMNSFQTNGMTPIPGAGTVYPSFRTTGDWGSLEADWVLMAADWSKLTLPADSTKSEGRTVTGQGWRLKLAPGWSLQMGKRAGDYVLTRDAAPPPS